MRLSVFLLLAPALLLAACSPAAPSPTAAPTLAPSSTPAPTQTASSTPTATASLTPTVTFTASPTFTPQPSPTPLAAFDQAKAIALASGVGGWKLTLSVPNLAQVYDVIAAGIEFNCSFDAQYIGLLFCYGLARPPLDQTITLAFLDQTTRTVVFQMQTVFASAALPTPVPSGYSAYDCPDRGKNVTCETECRVAPDGTPCMVSSCFDACGPYFSVDSCPAGVSTWSMCSDAQLADLKARYNIP